MKRWLVAALLCPNLALAADLGGAWEVQSMGGDRKVDLQQRGDKLIAHRVMWPTFEGQKYKLEHLYRGTLSGNAVRGELLVKEEGVAEYEILRAFDGHVTSNDAITLDGLIMKRSGDQPAEHQARAGEPAARRQEATPPPAESPSEAPAATNPGGGLFASIMSSPGMENLFEDALKVEIPKEVARLTASGDELFARGKLEEALAKFEQASQTGGGNDPQLLHRKGRCLLKLRRFADAKKVLRSALKLDPDNKRIRRDYKNAKRRAR